MVESAEPGSSDLNRVIREPINVEEIVFSDGDLGKATVWPGIPCWVWNPQVELKSGVILSSLQQKLEAGR